ncbi:ABC transporter permease (plasmid) [Bacillus sp. 31A1R]|uniref:ABC transporter permease n=1 Tax=Robertmurraya mangrovi TaxID=3098077 RepID=A0ABU5IUM5_9BACI|nr:ABC transporter permease [Bacillus sp. 31A1R]MDZ5470867.1 ABC transporter permease [Bacillus sp. 31A1R]
MFNLIRNECLKIFKRTGTYVMVGLLILLVTVMGAFFKYQDSKGDVPDNENWQRGLQMENESIKKDIKELEGNIPQGQINYLKKQVAINEYRIENDLSPNSEYAVWDFVNDASVFIEFAGLFTIVIAAGIVASEFNWGTIKLLLIRPINRSRILIAKYATVVIFAFIVLTVLFSYSALLGALLFGIPETSVPYLVYKDGLVTEQNMVSHLVIFFGLTSINMIMLATMAFMISAVFRSSNLAIGLSIFLMFTGGQITSMLASKYSWAKYILFANTDLIRYFEGVPLVEGMTLTFSIIMLFIYFALFQFLAFYIFKKRDVAA